MKYHMGDNVPPEEVNLVLKQKVKMVARKDIFKKYKFICSRVQLEDESRKGVKNYVCQKMNIPKKRRDRFWATYKMDVYASINHHRSDLAQSLK